MRKFSDFREAAHKLAADGSIQEDIGGVTLAADTTVRLLGGPYAADDIQVGVHPQDVGAFNNIQDPDVLDRLNLFVSAMGAKPYLNPYFAMNRLWTKLQMIGIGFDVNSVRFDQDAGSVSLPLNQFGGRYGFVDMDGVVKQDDGISQRVPGGLKLVVHYVKHKGVVTLDAQIEKGELPAGYLALGEDSATEKITVRGQDYKVQSRETSKSNNKNTEVVATPVSGNKNAKVRITVDPKKNVKNLQKEQEAIGKAFKNRFRIYTGPSIVKAIAKKLSQNKDVQVDVTGTAHVHVSTDLDNAHLLRILGPTWKVSDVQRIGK